MRASTHWVVVTGVSGTLLPDSETPQVGELLVTRTGASFRGHPHLPTVSKRLGDAFAATLNTALLSVRDLDSAVEIAAHTVLSCILARSSERE